MMEHTDIPPIDDPLFDEWLHEHNYTIDVRDRASIVARKGFIGIGRYPTFEQACEAVIKYHSERTL